MSSSRFFHPLESRALFSAATFTAADLAGPWLLAAMGSHGNVSFDASGNLSGTVKDDTNASVSPTGTYVLASTGTVSTSSASGLGGAMNASKNFVVVANTTANKLALLVDRGNSSFALALAPPSRSLLLSSLSSTALRPARSDSRSVAR